MKLIITLSLLASCLSSLAAAEGGYIGSCGLPTMMGSAVYTKCGAPGEDRTNTMMKLDGCYANDDGKLIPRKDGGGLKNCDSCSISHKGTLSCWCVNKADDPVRTSVETNDIISNVDGVLYCHGKRGGCLSTACQE